MIALDFMPSILSIGFHACLRRQKLRSAPSLIFICKLAAENAIRPFTVGRKNWLFSNSIGGTNASAVAYTMVEMAKAHGLNIYGYLKFLPEHRTCKDMTEEQLAELAPWSEKLQSIKNRI